MESLTPKFEEFNETDVREEIIAPLLRHLVTALEPITI